MNQLTISIDSKEDLRKLSNLSKEYAQFLKNVKTYPSYLIVGTIDNTISPLGIYNDLTEIEQIGNLILKIDSNIQNP